MKIVTYQDLLQINVKENNEKFVTLDDFHILNQYPNNFSDYVLGDNIIVRKSVAEKLLVINTFVQQQYNLHLLVTFGYRSLELQTQRFLERLQIVSKEKIYPNTLDLYEEIHKTVAVPTVAGHPTGGAIDVVLIDQEGKILDFGSPMYDYSIPGYETFAACIDEKSKKNRMLLREVMMQEGFAPFDGEYRHFSYGDKEWAYYYNQGYALYDQITLEQVKQ